MMFRGALIRLAVLYMLLLALILACFNVIVYFSMSEALHARVSADLRDKARKTIEALDISEDSVAKNAYAADPTYADTFVFVVQTKGFQTTVVDNAPPLPALEKLPNVPLIDKAARAGQTTETEVTVSDQHFAVLTQPLKDKKQSVVGVLQAAKPINNITGTLTRLQHQLAIASAVAMLLGAIAALLMARLSLQPIRLAFQKQREFVADASHELRTPLTLIRTNAEASLRRARGSPPGIYAEHILEEVDQLNAIVSDLTTLALADARQLKVDRKPVELTGIVQELLEHTAPLAEERGIRLNRDLDGGVTVQADASRMRQLLLILLDNALAYTPSGGEVSVGVAREHGKARITISDDGTGIAPADLPHIFERFYRADKARSRENGGIGLGLAIAKWIVEAHKGAIEVKSGEGRGTQVAVSLPTTP